MNKKLLAFLNLIIPVISIITIIYTTSLDEKLLSIILLTLIIGCIMPFIALLITGLSILNNTHQKLSITMNTLSLILSLILIILLILIINKNFIALLISYIIVLILNIINIIYFIKYIKANPNIEYINIKKEKEKNNGAIV